MGISIRKWSQQERIDNTEYCGRCANAKREGENRDASESWGFAQHAQAEAQILNEILNPLYASRVTAFLFGLLDALQVESRAAVRFFLRDRKSTRLNSSHTVISYAVFCVKKKSNAC